MANSVKERFYRKKSIGSSHRKKLHRKHRKISIEQMIQRINSNRKVKSYDSRKCFELLLFMIVFKVLRN